MRSLIIGFSCLILQSNCIASNAQLATEAPIIGGSVVMPRDTFKTLPTSAPAPQVVVTPPPAEDPQADRELDQIFSALQVDSSDSKDNHSQ